MGTTQNLEAIDDLTTFSTTVTRDTIIALCFQQLKAHGGGHSFAKKFNIDG